MADEIKNIFKNEIINEPKIQKVLRNKIQGVFGDVINVIQTPRENPSYPNIIFLNRDANHTYDLTRTLLSYNSSNNGNDLAINMRYQYSFNTVLNISQDFAQTIHPLTSVQIFTRLIYDRHQTNFIPSGMENYINLHILMQLAASNLPINVPVPGTFEYNFIPDIQSNIGLVVGPVEEAFDFTSSISNRQVTKRNVSFTATLSMNHTGMLQGDVVENNFQVRSANIDILIPKWIEITIAADTMTTILIPYSIGLDDEVIKPTDNAMRINSNPFVTMRSSINNIPLYQYIGNTIINEWHDGKQTMQLQKVINENNDLSKVDDNAIILRTREDDLVDINEQSFSRNQDGTAKVFDVDSAEFRYDGSYRQVMDLSEKIE